MNWQTNERSKPKQTKRKKSMSEEYAEITDQYREIASFSFESECVESEIEV